MTFTGKAGAACGANRRRFACTRTAVGCFCQLHSEQAHLSQLIGRPLWSICSSGGRVKRLVRGRCTCCTAMAAHRPTSQLCHRLEGMLATPRRLAVACNHEASAGTAQTQQQHASTAGMHPQSVSEKPGATYVIAILVPHPVLVLLVGAAVVDHDIGYWPATNGRHWALKQLVGLVRADYSVGRWPVRKISSCRSLCLNPHQN